MVDISVCVGSACHLKGAYGVIQKLQSIVQERQLNNDVTIKACFCLGKCTEFVAVKVNETHIFSVGEEHVENFFNEQIVGRLDN